MTTLTNEEILSLTAVELGAKIKAGELTSVEAVTAYLDRAEAVEKDINAFITLDREDALAAAAEADRKIAAGELTGPLAGVPVAIKSPALRVMIFEIYFTNSSGEKIMCLVFESCLIFPFTFENIL